MDLPPSLSHFRPALELFHEALARPLLVFVERLSRLLGPLSGGDEDGGDPDGYAGLESHGPYERLLASEWLLLDTHPDEFIRRAANREHLFTALNRKGARRPRTSVLLVDPGAAMLGAPRLGLLASVICMEARARAAQSSFAWALIDDPPGTLRASLDEEAVRLLLSASVAKPATLETLSAFRESLKARPGDELWLAGTQALGKVATLAKVGSLLFADVLEPEVRRLAVRVVPPTGGAREVLIELPPDDVTTRLLRGLFRPSPGVEPRVEVPGSWVVFSADESRALLARGAGVWRLSTATKGNARARHYEAARHRKLVAAGFRDREPVLASFCEGTISLESPGTPPFAELALDVAASQLVGPLGRIVAGPVDSMWVRLPGSAVFELCPVRKRVIRIATRSLLLSGLGKEGQVACLGKDKTRGGQGAYVFQTQGVDHSSSMELPMRPVRAFLGLTQRRKRGVLAVEVEDKGDFQMFDGDRRWAVASPGLPVLGVVASAADGGDAGLLVRDGEGLLGVGRTWKRRMYSSQEEILHVALAPSSWLAAVVFADEKVAFVRLPEGQVRAYYEGGKSVPARVDG